MRLLELTLREDHSILVEVGEGSGGIERASPLPVVDKVSKTLEHVLGCVKDVADTAARALMATAHQPSDIQLEFGIKLNSQGGIIIASGGVEANFKIVISWKDKYS